MKHFFIINPAAGQGMSVELEEKIWEQAELRGLTVTADQKRGVNEPEDFDVIIYRTRSVGDAERYVKYTCKSIRGSDSEYVGRHSMEAETFRFYACGGDGTLNEVVNGCLGYDFAEVACVPYGTGNDYIRNYPEAGDFTDVGAQMDGSSVMSDVIKYTVENEEPRFCINMFNIGLDCNVADLTSRMKRLPLVEGHFAYILSLLVTFVQKKGTELTIEDEDGSVYDGKLLLIAIANGTCCGGGVKGIPQAITNDGLMDVSIVKQATRREFIKLFNEYKKGAHLDDERAMKHFLIRKCRRLAVAPKKGKMKLCIDGEINYAGRTEFEIVPDAVKFSLPKVK